MSLSITGDGDGDDCPAFNAPWASKAAVCCRTTYHGGRQRHSLFAFSIIGNFFHVRNAQETEHFRFTFKRYIKDFPTILARYISIVLWVATEPKLFHAFVVLSWAGFDLPLLVGREDPFHLSSVLTLPIDSCPLGMGSHAKGGYWQL